VEKFSMRPLSHPVHGPPEPANLLSRRTPVLLVPEKVCAPSEILIDVGAHAFKSMQNSPKHSHRKVDLGVIDDIDLPPNHETYKEYITSLDAFMYKVQIHPERLTEQVAALRGSTFSDHTDDSDGSPVRFPTAIKKKVEKPHTIPICTRRLVEAVVAREAAAAAAV